jgi:hypothetical protein
MTRSTAWKLAPLFAALITFAPAAHAGLLSDPENAGFSPRVPLSAFARPASWFDPSRLHLMSTVSVGSGFGGQTSALQTTRLSYQFGKPLTMSVSVGNTFGLDKARGSSFFLEGFDLSWRPSANSVFRVEMRDVRSPLQYDYWGRSRDPLYAPY